MPTFTPPTASSSSLIGTTGPTDTHTYPLFKYYGTYQVAATLWRDQAGVYHYQQYPYQGGTTSRVYNDTQFTESAPDSGLANATEIYDGGHTYTITQQTADDLTAAGYGDYITP